MEFIVVLYSIVYGSNVRYSLITIISLMGSYYVWMQCECVIIGSWHRDACLSRYVAHTWEYDRPNKHHSHTYSNAHMIWQLFLTPPPKMSRSSRDTQLCTLSKNCSDVKYSTMVALDDICHERNTPPWLFINLPNLPFATNLMLDELNTTPQNALWWGQWSH